MRWGAMLAALLSLGLGAGAALAQTACGPQPLPLLWCEKFDTYAGGTSFGLGGCGTAVSGNFCTTLAINTNSGITLATSGAISGTTLTVSGVSGAGLFPGMWLYDRVGGAHAAGNAAIDGQTYIVSQLTGARGSDGTYQVSISQTVSAEKLAAGYWEPQAYIHNNKSVSPSNSMVVGENGGGISIPCSGNCTERFLGYQFTKVTLDMWAWFTDPTCSNCGWSTPDFGFHRLVIPSFANNCGPCVRFGSGNSPPAGDVNLELFRANFTSVGNVNVTANAWHHITLSSQISTAANLGSVVLSVDGVAAITYTGVNPGPTSSLNWANTVQFAGADVGGTPDAEAYFDDISAYGSADDVGLTWIN